MQSQKAREAGPNGPVAILARANQPWRDCLPRSIVRAGMNIEQVWSWVRRVGAVLVAVSANALLAVPAFADHTTRDEVIHESGVNYLLVALVILGAIVALAVFATAILIWEHRDSDSPSA
jgi:hypothetical protein